MKYVFKIVRLSMDGAVEIADYGLAADGRVAKDIMTWIESTRKNTGLIPVSFPLYDSLEDYKENCPDAIRERGLKKLTLEERRALGLEK